VGPGVPSFFKIFLEDFPMLNWIYFTPHFHSSKKVDEKQVDSFED
jgi:hypothetical protein